MTDKNHPLYKRALLLEYLTIVWNVFEAFLAIVVGFISGSVSILAYGLESSVEIFSSSLVVWDLKGADRKREKTALKLIGFAYLVVSAYVFIDASQSLLAGHHAEKTAFGITIMIANVIGMGILGVLKRTAGNKMKSPTVLADAKFTLIDAALAGTVLVGLVFNFFLGWWWTDQALALFLSGVAFREGIREIL